MSLSLESGAQYHKDFNAYPGAAGDHFSECAALDTRSPVLCGSITQCDVLKNGFQILAYHRDLSVMFEHILSNS